MVVQLQVSLEAEMTGKQACELIVYALGLQMTPIQVWEADDHGELWHVPMLLETAEVRLSQVGLGPRQCLH